MKLDRYERDLAIFGFVWFLGIVALIYVAFSKKPVSSHQVGPT